MSRSNKKPIVKDSRRSTSRGARRISHKRFRQASRALINKGRYESLPCDESEFMNDYDICDIRYDMRWEPPGSEWEDFVKQAARK